MLITGQLPCFHRVNVDLSFQRGKDIKKSTNGLKYIF